MARVVIPITNLNPNSVLTPPTATTADSTNDHYVAAGGKTDNLFVEAIAGGTGGDGGDVIIKAGANPPAFRSGLGDLTVTLPDVATRILGPFESARFAQVNGDLNIDLTSFVGTLRCYRLPKV